VEAGFSGERVTFYLIVLMTIITHTSFKGSKMLISLFAIDLGASPFVIGVLFAMYSVFPVLISVYAGKLSDRIGARFPMLFGVCGMMVGLALPWFVPRLETLYVSAGLIGLCYIFDVFSVQLLIGTLGDECHRTRNYSLDGLGIAATRLFGPVTAGFAIDLMGYRSTYLLLALLPTAAVAALVFFPTLIPKWQHSYVHKPEHRVTDLLKNVSLRRVLISSAIVETGFELFNFFLPIYGRSIGLSASEIGIVMGAFGGALLVVRLVLPALSRRTSEERVMSSSLFLAAATCLLFPLVSSFPLLMLMSFLLGLGLGCGSPLSMILSYNRSPPGRSGEAMGVRQTVGKSMECLMPLVFGSVGTALGMGPTFWLDAVVLWAGGMLMRKESKVQGRKDMAARPPGIP